MGSLLIIGKPWNDFSLSLFIVSRLCLLVSSLIRILGSVCQIRILRFSKMQRTHAYTHAHHVNTRQVKTTWTFVDTRKVSSGNSPLIVIRWWFHSFLFLSLFFCQEIISWINIICPYNAYVLLTKRYLINL